MDRPLRFCMITTFYPPYNFGGDGIFVHRLSNELARRGHQVDVIHCTDAYRFLARQEPTGTYDNHPNVTVHGLKSRFGFLSPLATQQTGFPFFKSGQIQRILEKGFDVIHYHNISLVGGPKILEYGQGIKLYTMHEHWLVCPTHILFRFNRAPCMRPHCFLCNLTYKRPPQWWRYFGLLEAAVKHVDTFISPSHFTKDKHHQMGLNIPIVHLPNFVPPVELSSSTVEEAIGEALNEPYFLFVGRLEKLKGLQTLIPVFRHYQKAQLLIAGTGNDENTTVLVVSDHGFGPLRHAIRGLNPLFVQLGLLRYRQGKSRLKSRLLKSLLLYGRKILPFSLQDPLARALPGLHRRAVSEYNFSGIEWSQTQVFARHQYIFINLQGREAEGTISPEDYHPLRERVRDILLNLTDPTTGNPVIRAVQRREDIYHGPYLERAPDLVIEWDDEVLQDSLCYRVEGREPVIIQTPKSSGPGKSWIGTHRPQGIFIAYGPHIKRGATVVKPTLYDIAPTILYLQGHPIPMDMDGKVLTDIFTEEQLCHRPIQQGEPSSVKSQTTTSDLDAKEARKIEERLRDLGYIE